MKSLILAIILTGFMATTVQAADIVITITIPSQHVSRVAAMVTNTLNCEELGPKACLAKEIRTDIKKRVIAYEEDLIDQSASTEKDALVDPTVN